MSLNWDGRKCGDAWKEMDSNKREALIFATMYVDMGEITEKNHEDFYLRYVQFHMATGHKDDLYLSQDDVKDAIGLTTNVFTTTPAAWRKRLVTFVENAARDKMYRDKRAAAAKLEQEATDA